MNEPQAYCNGRYVPATQASVSVGDAGFVLGATVAEQLRTFAGKLFRLDAHLERLDRSLDIVGIRPSIGLAEIARIAQELATHNHRFLQSGDDLNLTIFVTPGLYATMAGQGASHEPTVCIHTFPLPFHLWAKKYSEGDSLAIPGVEQTSPQCWPRELKCRSRMHYFLADRMANALVPGARALMIDDAGFITEATTANVLAYFPDQGLVGPPRAKVLPGISLSVLVELAQRAGIAYSERDLRPGDLASAQEILLASTSLCVAPVIQFNGKPVGRGLPGPIQELLLASWSRLVGVDIAAQALQFSSR